MRVHEVPAGQVPAAAGALTGALAAPSHAEEGVRVRPLVALGGGRVIDVAKAIAAISGAEVVAIPTTLSGAPMTGIHRLPAGAEERVQGMVRPSLVIADPEAMTGQPERDMRASAMNALAHGADTLYSPFSNPVSEMTALRGAELIGSALDEEREERDRAVARPRLDPLRLRDRLRRPRSAPRDLPDPGPRLRHAARRDQRGDPAAGAGVVWQGERRRPMAGWRHALGTDLRWTARAGGQSSDGRTASATSAATRRNATRQSTRCSSGPSWSACPARGRLAKT